MSPSDLIVERVVSGGQTGVDRAALDVAIELEIPHGGWCPRGRLAEDGVIPARYELTEHESAEYSRRTEQNVIDSDGTLILYVHALSGGTLLTYRYAQQHQRDHLCVDLGQEILPEEARQWIRERQINILNVAGPRASGHAEVYPMACEFLRQVLVGR